MSHIIEALRRGVEVECKSTEYQQAVHEQWCRGRERGQLALLTLLTQHSALSLGHQLYPNISVLYFSRHTSLV